MADRPTLVLGGTVYLRGDVTQNRWVGARSASELERSVGYGPGRLAKGWWVLLLKQALSPEDFKFSGITLRSGGRLGLPAATPALDQQRAHVSDQILAQRGAAGYQDLQQNALRSITPTGETRLVKIIPVTPHSDTMAPEDQYPMGGGGLQWTLIRPCRFLVAMAVDEAGIARIATEPPQSYFLGASARYETRAAIARFLNEA
jgi:hypothetical protein